jgi:hypothetical protein
MAPRTRAQTQPPPRTPPARRPRAAPNAPARVRRLNLRLPGGAARSLASAFELSTQLEATAHGESQTVASENAEAHAAGLPPREAAN